MRKQVLAVVGGLGAGLLVTTVAYFVGAGAAGAMAVVPVYMLICANWDPEEKQNG